MRTSLLWALSLVAIVASATVGFGTVASAFSCSEGLQTCLGREPNKKGCRQSFNHCMKTGRWVWVPTGRDWGPHDRR